MLSLQRREHRQAWVLLAPMLIAMFILTAWPLARTLWLSFTDTALAGSGEVTHYVWLDNYLYALTDPDFRAAFARTLYFTVVSVAIEGAIGVLVALLLNQRFVGRNVLRVDFKEPGQQAADFLINGFLFSHRSHLRRVER